MKKIAKEDIPIERFELPRAEAIKYMEEREEPYKVELIQDLPEDAVISFYKQGGLHRPVRGTSSDEHKDSEGNQADLCCRRLLERLRKEQNAFRIYGTAYPKASELDAYLTMMEEAKKRDHRKLGKELKLFALLDEGPWLPLLPA